MRYRISHERLGEKYRTLCEQLFPQELCVTEVSDKCTINMAKRNTRMRRHARVQLTCAMSKSRTTQHNRVLSVRKRNIHERPYFAMSNKTNKCSLTGTMFQPCDKGPHLPKRPKTNFSKLRHATPQASWNRKRILHLTWDNTQLPSTPFPEGKKKKERDRSRGST